LTFDTVLTIVPEDPTLQKDAAMVKKKSVDDVFGLLYRPPAKPQSVEEMDEAIAEHLRQKHTPFRTPSK
jgi:hypothetical protein